MARGLSQSGMSIFRDCPYAYKLRYFDRVEPMFFDHSILDVGSLVHDAIDDYYKHSYLAEGTANDILIETYDILKKNWDITLLPEQLKKAYICLQSHAIFEYDQIKDGNAVKPLTELKIDKNGFFGYIDYANPQKKLVMDYKTGSRPYVHHNYKAQAYVYKKLYEGKYGGELTHFTFFFLYSNEFRMLKYDSPKMLEIARGVEELKDDIVHATETNNFPKKPRTNGTCKNCLFKYYCRITKM